MNKEIETSMSQKQLNYANNFLKSIKAYMFNCLLLLSWSMRILSKCQKNKRETSSNLEIRQTVAILTQA